MPGFLRSLLHEIITPQMLRVLGSQSQIGTILQPDPRAFGLSGRSFQAISPYLLNPLVVCSPPRAPQQDRDPATTIAAKFDRQFNNVFGNTASSSA